MSIIDLPREHEKHKPLEPLVVSPSQAWQLLGCSHTYGWGLINSGDLESYLEGPRRKITVASIHALIARRLEAAKAAGPAAAAST